ncbi:MAG TPA: LAGLIDADG family homing endonuclease [Candidatus Paceibacterota bacterium]|nr:LAGLIDADG family homing endonuclease [Candidatus Paceibacterota bacterium]
MKARKIDNFKKWRDSHRVRYAEIPHNGDLAEYIGVVLGDGNIEAFPRTERITIVGDAKKMDFIYRYTKMTQSLFKKAPAVAKASYSNAVRISLYQKFISKRLEIPTGNKEQFPHILPLWIENNEQYLIRFLRGLYEAEAYLSIHLPTSTYNFGFVNTNPYLLKIVEIALRRLEFHPEIRHNAIRIRKKAEVERLKNLLHFRQY